MRRSLLALCFLAAACSQGRGASDAGDAGGAETGVSANECRVEAPSVEGLFQANVLVVFDRSESMGSGFGAGTRFSAMSAALNDIVSLYEGRIRFGLAAFPSPGCPSGCCASDKPLVDLALDNAAAVRSGLASLPPMEGQTPTAAALDQARRYYASLPEDGLARYVLLVTDGWPTCGLDQLPSGPDDDADGGTWPACDQAIDLANQLTAMGVRVIVLGLGTESSADTRSGCLDELALAGGAARSPGHPSYYSVQTPEELQLTLEAIFGGVTRPSCLLRFLHSPAPFPYVVKVYLDGQEIPQDRQAGWDFEPPTEQTQVRLFGEYCRRAEHFQFSTFEVRYTCPVF